MEKPIIHQSECESANCSVVEVTMENCGGKNEKLDEFDEDDYSEDSMIGIPLNEKDYNLKGNAGLVRTEQKQFTRDRQPEQTFSNNES